MVIRPDRKQPNYAVFLPAQWPGLEAPQGPGAFMRPVLIRSTKFDMLQYLKPPDSIDRREPVRSFKRRRTKLYCLLPSKRVRL